MAGEKARNAVVDVVNGDWRGPHRWQRPGIDVSMVRLAVTGGRSWFDAALSGETVQGFGSVSLHYARVGLGSLPCNLSPGERRRNGIEVAALPSTWHLWGRKAA